MVRACGPDFFFFARSQLFPFHAGCPHPNEVALLNNNSSLDYNWMHGLENLLCAKHGLRLN